MRKPDAFARTVLSAGPPEQFEDTLVILLGDAAAVVGDVYVHATRRFARRETMRPGRSRARYFTALSTTLR